MDDQAQEVLMTPSEMVERYIKLRDTKKASRERFDEWEKEQYNAEMEGLELKLLDTLNQLGADHISGPSGTVMKIHKTSVTVADQAQFRRHIIGAEAWDQIEWRPSKTAINDMIEEGGELPPGLNRSVFTTVGIRKKS